MNTLDYVLILLIIFVFLLLVYLIVRFNKWQKELTDLKSNESSGITDIFLKQFNELSRLQQDVARRFDEKLNHTQERLHDSLRHQSSESLKAIRDVTEKLVKLDETNKQVVSFADQLQNLQDILKNPKQRGILGEYYLGATLKNVLAPNNYALQYKIADGFIVDAVVFVRDRIIPIDSKFSLENYNRLVEAKEPAEQDRLEKLFKSDLKKRIDETSKYIMPEKGTMEFAFMFIPHEAIYYDLLVNEVGATKVRTQDLVEYAFSKNVLIVSPTSFLAFLQTVLQGLKSLEIEESAKQIQLQVEQLEKHLRVYEDYHQKVGSTLGTLVNHYNSSSKEFRKIDKDVSRVIGKKSNYELDLIDKPDLH